MHESGRSAKVDKSRGNKNRNGLGPGLYRCSSCAFSGLGADRLAALESESGDRHLMPKLLDIANADADSYGQLLTASNRCGCLFSPLFFPPPNLLRPLRPAFLVCPQGSCDYCHLLPEQSHLESGESVIPAKAGIQWRQRQRFLPAQERRAFVLRSNAIALPPLSPPLVT